MQLCVITAYSRQALTHLRCLPPLRSMVGTGRTQVPRSADFHQLATQPRMTILRHTVLP